MGKVNPLLSSAASGASSPLSTLSTAAAAAASNSSSSSAKATFATAGAFNPTGIDIHHHPPTPAASAEPSTTTPEDDGGDLTARRKNGKRVYHWVSEEAEELIARAYQRHKALADTNASFPPSLNLLDLEKLEEPYHFKPRDWIDRLALRSMRFMRVFTHLFFREKYDHHAVVLETVAAVPGIVASAARHLRSLRKMKNDNGWINPLQEEAENERMHLLIWMQVTKPTFLERGLVMVAQGVYLHFYIALYLLSPRAAHRFVGYLEEEAHAAYTDYLRAIDNSAIPNGPAPDIARRYYHLDDSSTIRDVVLHVRADECMHRDFNHMLGEKLYRREVDSTPFFMSAGDGSKNEFKHGL